MKQTCKKVTVQEKILEYRQCSSCYREFFQHLTLPYQGNMRQNLKSREFSSTTGEWPSGPANSISSTEVKDGCVPSETGWATFHMNDQNSSLRRPLEGTLN